MKLIRPDPSARRDANVHRHLHAPVHSPAHHAACAGPAAILRCACSARGGRLRVPVLARQHSCARKLPRRHESLIRSAGRFRRGRWVGQLEDWRRGKGVELWCCCCGIWSAGIVSFSLLLQVAQRYDGGRLTAMTSQCSAMFGLQTVIFAYHYHLYLSDIPPIAATTVPHGVPPRAGASVEKPSISAPTAADPAALEAGALANERDSGVGYHAVTRDAGATPPPPPPPPPHDSPLIGAGGRVVGGERRHLELPASRF